MKIKVGKKIILKMLFLIGVVFFVSEGFCQKKPFSENKIKKEFENFQHILDSSVVKGSILIYDPQLEILYSNDFARCEKGFLPASTFKITNTVIALELGVIDSSTTFKWNGEKRRLQQWEKDMTIFEAFNFSCVPCFQEIARIIGVERMKVWLDTFDYGSMAVDSSNIDLFWLEGESTISMFQQIDFLRKLYFSLHPLSEKTINQVKKIMLIETNSQYKFSGKTGWVIRNDNNIGWFVGYLETNNKVFFIATNIEPRVDFNMNLFPKIRIDISLKAFKELRIIN